MIPRSRVRSLAVIALAGLAILVLSLSRSRVATDPVASAVRIGRPATVGDVSAAQKPKETLPRPVELPEAVRWPTFAANPTPTPVRTFAQPSPPPPTPPSPPPPTPPPPTPSLTMSATRGPFSERHLVCELEQHLECLARILEYPSPQYVFYTASPGEDGQPWCPDCRRSIGTVREQVDRLGGSLLEINVGSRAVWKSPDNPLRHVPWLQLTGVPTLVRWGRQAGETQGAVLARVSGDLEHAPTVAVAERVVAEFLERTKDMR